MSTGILGSSVLRRAKRPYTRDVAMQLYLFEQQLHSKGLHKYIYAAECCNVRGSGLIARQKSVFQTGAAPVLHDGQFRWSGWPFYLFLNHSPLIHAAADCIDTWT